MFSIEVAKSGRAKCHKCKKPIEQGSLKVVEQGFNQWVGRPTSTSNCSECSKQVLLGIKVKVEQALAQIEGTADYAEIREGELKSGKRISI
jgi:DNA-directed RNA polymerase subunit RPC12/RpoP